MWHRIKHPILPTSPKEEESQVSKHQSAACLTLKRVIPALKTLFNMGSTSSFGLNEFNNEPKALKKEVMLIFRSKMLKWLLAPASFRL